jgi:hypothetical protein
MLGTQAVCKIFELAAYHIVFLQEVIPQTLLYFQNNLPAYRCISGSQEAYFVCTLLRNGRVFFDQSRIVDFPTSMLGRHLLAVSAHCGQVNFDLFNTHLAQKMSGSCIKAR